MARRRPATRLASRSVCMQRLSLFPTNGPGGGGPAACVLNALAAPLDLPHAARQGRLGPLHNLAVLPATCYAIAWRVPASPGPAATSSASATTTVALPHPGLTRPQRNYCKKLIEKKWQSPPRRGISVPVIRPGSESTPLQWPPFLSRIPGLMLRGHWHQSTGRRESCDSVLVPGTTGECVGISSFMTQTDSWVRSSVVRVRRVRAMEFRKTLSCAVQGGLGRSRRSGGVHFCVAVFTHQGAAFRLLRPSSKHTSLALSGARRHLPVAASPVAACSLLAPWCAHRAPLVPRGCKAPERFT